MEFCGTINYLLFFFVLGGFTMVLSILSAKLAPHFSPVFSMKSWGETRVILKKKKKKRNKQDDEHDRTFVSDYIVFLFFFYFYTTKNPEENVVSIQVTSSYLNCGTLRGRRRLLTTGGTWPFFGNAGLLAQRAALVNCETKEKELRSGPELVRNTFLILDFKPVEEVGNGVVGIGVTCDTNLSFSLMRMSS